jgi:hypothetical protein
MNWVDWMLHLLVLVSCGRKITVMYLKCYVATTCISMYSLRLRCRRHFCGSRVHPINACIFHKTSLFYRCKYFLEILPRVASEVQTVAPNAPLCMAHRYVSIHITYTSYSTITSIEVSFAFERIDRNLLS